MLLAALLSNGYRRILPRKLSRRDIAGIIGGFLIASKANDSEIETLLSLQNKIAGHREAIKNLESYIEQMRRAILERSQHTY